MSLHAQHQLEALGAVHAGQHGLPTKQPVEAGELKEAHIAAIGYWTVPNTFKPLPINLPEPIIERERHIRIRTLTFEGPFENNNWYYDPTTPENYSFYFTEAQENARNIGEGNPEGWEFGRVSNYNAPAPLQGGIILPGEYEYWRCGDPYAPNVPTWKTVNIFFINAAKIFRDFHEDLFVTPEQPPAAISFQLRSASYPWWIWLDDYANAEDEEAQMFCSDPRSEREVGKNAISLFGEARYHVYKGSKLEEVAGISDRITALGEFASMDEIFAAATLSGYKDTGSTGLYTPDSEGTDYLVEQWDWDFYHRRMHGVYPRFF
jgi:hypothetical protein